MFFPFIGYAEVHHRRGSLPNFLWQNEPEIFCDFPRRIEPGTREFPVIISVKDAHLFPIFIVEVTLKFLFPRTKHEESLFKGKMLVNKPLKQLLFETPLRTSYSGEAPVAVEVRYFIGGREKIITNHNYMKIKPELWMTRFAEESRPLFPGWYAGDIHWHSSMSCDDVEFGMDVELVRPPASVMGLHFIAVTDHSYDLDDLYQNHREKDTRLSKWKDLQKSIDRMNQKSVDFTLIRGEEASLGNDRGRNVHALILGSREFVPGSGDSAEATLQNKPDNSLKAVREEGHFIIAAHPFEGAHLLPYLFLRRGTWSDKDLELAGGMEFYNGNRGKGFDKGKKKWIERLLKGQKIYAYGGSDAHGDFIRYFKIEVPFLKMGSSRDHLTGAVQTHVQCRKVPNEAILLENLKKGHCYVTDGPALSLEVKGFPEKGMGDTVEAAEGIIITAKALSTAEYGSFRRVALIGGKRDGTGEVTFEEDFTGGFTAALEGKAEARFRYVRIEAETETGKIAFSNPLFLD